MIKTSAESRSDICREGGGTRRELKVCVSDYFGKAALGVAEFDLILACSTYENIAKIRLFGPRARAPHSLANHPRNTERLEIFEKYYRRT